MGQVIIDELHELAASKARRRLRRAGGSRRLPTTTRIGLSATVADVNALRLDRAAER